MIKNKILSKEILLLEPFDDHTHEHTNVLLCCGTVLNSVELVRNLVAHGDAREGK